MWFVWLILGIALGAAGCGLALLWVFTEGFKNTAGWG